MAFFQQIKFIITPAEYESLCEKLDTMGALSITLLDAEDNPIYEPEPGTQPIWENAIVLALFDDKADLKNYAVEIIEDKNWQRECMDLFQPQLFGEKLWICPSWHEINTQQHPDAVIVKLDPGLAFGTGSHHTTKLCLIWLATHELDNKIILDYGTGSGILAISAAKLGAKTVYAVDIDTQALQATEENAANNHINSQQLKIFTPENLPAISADIIIANILANPLITLAPVFLNYLKPNGELVLSGILISQLDDVKKAFEPEIIFDMPLVEENWVRLSGRRSSYIMKP